MPRNARKAPGGMVFHVLNRGVGRRTIFCKDRDYAAFEAVLESVLDIIPMRLLAFCLMPTHWHLLLWPREDRHLAAFMQRLSITHVRRWQEHYHEGGYGHLYQGRFKSFPVQEDGHFLTVARYIERNALRAGKVQRAEDWQWCSLWRMQKGSAQERGILSQWPLNRPRDWVERVNRPQTEKELQALRLSVSRGRPFGSDDWQRRTAKKLGLESTYRKPGRPRKMVLMKEEA